MRLLVIGRGRMGQLVASLAPEYGCDIAASIDSSSAPELRSRSWEGVEAAIDFSTATAFVENFPTLAALRLNVVVGTTGWHDRADDMRRVAADAAIGVIASANFSPGLSLVELLLQHAAAGFGAGEYGAWIHESHHAAKRDAPSGTALALKAAIERGGFPRRIDISSTRAGFIPGTHTVGFDGPAETVTLTHSVRDRSTFARGALQAARWLHGRRGWFTMKDVMGIG